MYKNNVVEFMSGLIAGAVKVGDVVPIGKIFGEVAEIEKKKHIVVDPGSLKFINGNRDINSKHVNRIAKAMRLKNKLHKSPIKVNEKGEIIDGQHRTKAALQLALTRVPIILDEGGDLETAMSVHTFVKTWNLYDIAYSFSQQGNKEYAKYIEFHKETGIGLNDCVSILTGSVAAKYELFRNGQFKVKDYGQAMKIADHIQSFKTHTEEWLTSRFIRAFLSIRSVKGYNHRRMLHKMEMRRPRKCPDAKTYKQELQDIYNYKTSKSKKLRFVSL
jgi:hypothetical protein